MRAPSLEIAGIDEHPKCAKGGCWARRTAEPSNPCLALVIGRAQIGRDTGRAMSEENVNSLRWILQQLFGGRRIRPELLADDAEWVNPHDAIEPGIRRGADCFNEAISTVFTTWDDVRFDTERVIDSGDDVVALGQLWGRVDGAGMEIDSPHGQIWTFRDGRVVRMRWFNSHRETLEAAGLRE
jgi:ketosteroid isomerase-like protein